MAACWTCRGDVHLVMKVYGVIAEDTCAVCCDIPEQVWVAAPCGHVICGNCARTWAAHQRVFVRVPGGAVHAPAPAAPVPEYAAEPMLPPPWVLAPAAAPAMPLPFAMPLPLPALVPAIGEAFQFDGRPVLWVHLWRFGTNIVLVWADTGRLCQAGDHVVRPAGFAGWLVRWHEAGNAANRKWFLDAEVHEV